MAVRVGTVRFILGIAALIVVVQVLAMLHFSSTLDDHPIHRIHKVGMVALKSHVDRRAREQVYQHASEISVILSGYHSCTPPIIAWPSRHSYCLAVSFPQGKLFDKD